MRADTGGMSWERGDVRGIHLRVRRRGTASASPPAYTSLLCCLQSVSDWLKPACWGESSRLAASHSGPSAADASARDTCEL